MERVVNTSSISPDLKQEEVEKEAGALLMMEKLRKSFHHRKNEVFMKALQ